ncbi:CNNM domain-containing protein [Ornithinimicrobium pekingense]|uniref:Membrane protein n=1 Tax=Ornithinimicrobium pekingense TaxID=384677 RepID=A0ABQ2FCE1_9MICO|nr:hemolysin family protein [Ornithinimicrobium pekingense]GGK83319.1 membrane protein [Ornithinimicrobium pekingense]
MSDPVVVTLVTAVLIVASAFFVIIEFALLGARRQRLELEAPSSRSARSALRGMNELTLMLAGAQLGITAATFALGAVTKPALDAWLGPVLSDLGAPSWLAGGASFALSLLLVTFLHLVVGEMAPKSWAIAHPERAAKLVSPAGRAFVWVVRPLLLGINTLANRLVAASGVTPVDRAAVGGQDAATIRALVEHSAETGALETDFQRQINRVIDLERLTLGDLVPEDQRPVAVGERASVAEVQEAASTSGHLRILLAASDGSAAGVVHVRDTLVHDGHHPVRELARPAFVLPPDTPVYEALARMREHGEQLTVVAEPERTHGVVSVSDIMHRVLPSQVLVDPAIDPADAG